MCNMMAMLCGVPSFVEDPATTPASEKLLSSLSKMEPRRRQPRTVTSERYSLRPSGVSFQNEAFRLRTQTNISELVRTAESGSCSTNALLAQKALKYRRVLERRPSMTLTIEC